MFNKALVIIKREFMVKIKSKYFIFATILGPVIMFLISIAPIFFMRMSKEQSQTIVFVDKTEELVQYVEKNFNDKLSTGENKFELIFLDEPEYYENEEDIMKNLESGKYKALIELPDDIIDNYNAEITYLSNSLGDIESIESIKRKISYAIGSVRMKNEGIDPEKINLLTSPVSMKTSRIQKGKVETKNLAQDFLTAYVFVFILYITTILYSTSILYGVLEEKTSRVIEVLLSSCNTFDMMMGKLFGAGSVGLFQFFIWGILGGGIFFYVKKMFPEIPVMISITPSVLIYFLIFFLMGFFQYSTMFLAAGALSSNQDDAKQLAQPVTMLIILPFIVSFLGMNDPGNPIVQVLSFIPFFTPMLMFVRITVSSPTVLEIIFSVLLNFVFIFFILFLVSKIYRTGILMYGKRPTFKEVIKWFQYS
ncbi:MAG: ABC transporter permease [Candidatus Muiribacteriota bacterium]